MAAIRHWLRRNWTAIVGGIIALLLVVAFFKSWPYVIYQAGSAEPVHPRVETRHPLDEKGSFLFTTVSTRSRPNAFELLYARLNPRMDITTEESATGGTVNLAAYRNLLAWMRDSSEDGALIAAYTALKKDIQIAMDGTIVTSLEEQSKAREHGLQEGDVITAVDGQEAKSPQELTSILSAKKPGDVVKLTGTRGGKPFEVSVPLIQMDETGRAGVGFRPDAVLDVTAPDPVKFNFDDIGGPSAGLMMTLEIVAQLKGEDLTRGYRIAGTGTIAADGSVGQIGGIQYKLMAADREKADYFLVPYVESGQYSNWNEAEATVKKLNLDLQLVKVSSLQDALNFLEELEEKK
ncbi:PDZ domain-containing protein [Cohnella lubricantis]|uniref:PDZ domain-containing protein n=1 Tax=Cohnella lubricantis TaxID=2163172 RepID=A0A841TGF0_9BACL|nr:PDZ domain-containing protein [Cohnella lubricantis]MBB6679009.1 PDZ domain-containing protein [Cohnella lubricantis]MBP2119503.1 PDZ domain-containing protein [Cohnella lubricantis]